ncbi:hypothetical protein [uncultured Winogradskyella sp.]|uniref:polysialyltransferase family glycosyltransferase n=1 Tax=uncultured Winogradskyella sp. TaxID=395353 RepID=UPI00261DB6B3|nr:hypothetical protein [uncultured Winogradskyella sp.]
MKKILFVDEKAYRFSFYYNEQTWWLENGFNAVFKSYEKKKNKWFVYLWVIFNKPQYVVFVQLSTKNIYLTKLCNLLNIKTLFWQHGVFAYDDDSINTLKKINARLNTLLCFSEFDRQQINRYFRDVDHYKIIPHYEIEKISKGIRRNDTFLFIGQILSKEQLKHSNARIEYDKKSEVLLNQFWDYSSQKDIKISLKKHPGDRSNYLETLQQKFSNVTVEKDSILPKAVIGYYSTLILPYLSLGVPFIQLKHIRNKLVDFAVYDAKGIYKIDSEGDIDTVFRKVKDLEINVNQSHTFSISTELLKNFNL